MASDPTFPASVSSSELPCASLALETPNVRKQSHPRDRHGARKPSRRQLRVIELVAQGLKNREIAKRLGIGEYVVRNYLSKIYDKIGVSNRVELALWYETRLYEGKL